MLDSVAIPPSTHVVITGATGALGRAFTQLCVKQGAHVALIGHDAARLAHSFPDLNGAQHVLLSADVSSTDSMLQAAAQLQQRWPQVDALVHIAGGFEMGAAVHELDRASWDRMMNLNAWSFVAVTQAFVPAMAARGNGAVVAVSARSAARGAAQMAAYCASKSALQRLVESMAAELGPKGVRVNSIAPSVLDTPANRQAMPDADTSDWVSLDLAAQSMAYLLSAAAAPLRGQHLVLVA